MIFDTEPINEPASKSTLGSLMRSEFNFILTGGRRFVKNPMIVDLVQEWDYYAEDSEAVREFLLNHGFKRINALKDADCIDVYRCEDINIQLRADINTYGYACRLVDAMPSEYKEVLFYSASGEQQVVFWDNLISNCKLVLEEYPKVLTSC